MTRPPCWDEVNDRDCPDRAVGCKAGCEKWAEWLVIHEEELERARKKKHDKLDVDRFIAGAYIRDQQDLARKRARERRGR